MITWDPAKRRKNLREHGMDFAELEYLFDSPMITSEDRSENYGEQRLRSLGLHRGRVVVLIWVHDGDDTRIISCRNGDQRETRKYFKEAF